jgi:hypothetical protein
MGTPIKSNGIGDKKFIEDGDKELGMDQCKKTKLKKLK